MGVSLTDLVSPGHWNEYYVSSPPKFQVSRETKQKRQNVKCLSEFLRGQVGRQIRMTAWPATWSPKQAVIIHSVLGIISLQVSRCNWVGGCMGDISKALRTQNPDGRVTPNRKWELGGLPSCGMFLSDLWSRNSHHPHEQTSLMKGREQLKLS